MKASGKLLIPVLLGILASAAAYGNLLGDVNGDGLLTADDANLILQSVVLEIDPIDPAIGDVTGDGLVTAYDAAMILEMAANAGLVLSIEDVYPEISQTTLGGMKAKWR